MTERTQRRWLRLSVAVAAVLAGAAVASRAADESPAQGAAVLGAILVGVFVWEIAPVIRARGATFDVLRTWLRSQSRSLTVLGSLALVLTTVIAISMVFD